MVKSFISIIVALALLIGGAAIEQRALKRDFNMLNLQATILHDKTMQQTAVREDGLAVQKWWLKKKSRFNTYIPHDDIKDIDIWLCEAISLIETKQFDLALSKIEVLIELSRQMPKTYSVRLENIF